MSTRRLPNWLPVAVALAGAAITPQALSFCGFFVAQSDAPLSNESSKVVLARQGDQTTLTMANDYKGALEEFAIVFPVPVPITKEQVKVVEPAVMDRVDAYTAPRIAEYHDPDPCPEPIQYARPSAGTRMSAKSGAAMATEDSARYDRAAALGVKIEDEYTVGEYDIVLVSAEAGAGLETWLVEEGYKLPEGASAVLGSYIKQNMRFFLAKVNLDEHWKAEKTYLRPIQVTYESPKFMLPIRLGMLNADGPQELFVFALTPKGRIETTNYRTVKVPTDTEIPEYMRDQLSTFYKAMFRRQVAKHGYEGVFLEYAWPLTIVCDPCTAGQLNAAELSSLGANWATEYHGGVNGGFVTRLHLRYDMAHFPEDLVFQETSDSSTFQARYVVHRAFQGDTTCKAGQQYEKDLAARQEKEIANAASLTGWEPAEMRKYVPKRPNAPKPEPPPKTDGGSGNWWEDQ